MKKKITSKHKAKFIQDRPAVRLSRKPYLFELVPPLERREDKEFQLVCRSVIGLECHYRIHGDRNQDPVAILNAAEEQSTIRANHHNVLDYYDQFYNRIQQIDRSETIT